MVESARRVRYAGGVEPVARQTDRHPPYPIAGAVETFLRRLSATYGARLLDVRLFGSWARGEAHEHSDVDLLVVLDRVDWETRKAVINLGADVGLEHDLLLSPTVMDRATWALWTAQRRPLANAIEEEGIRL